MKATDQGVDRADYLPYTMIPRTLIFVTSVNPQTGDRDVLMLRGAPDKRLWPNRYNGLGGHVEPGENVQAAALRELGEEAGLSVDELELRAVVTIDTNDDSSLETNTLHPGVLVFVFTAETDEREVVASPEGMPEWISMQELYQLPLVDDLYELMPRVFSDAGMVYGAYRPADDKSMDYEFDR